MSIVERSSANSDIEELMDGDERILYQAKRRFTYAQEYEANARTNFLNDLKFANGDTYNNFQWPQDMLNQRTIDRRPALTVNKTRQHNLKVINDAKQNKPSVNIRPTGAGATYESAQVFEGIVRYIERQSNAQSAYDIATTFQVQAGIGYFRILTDYVNERTFDQDIFIRPIPDPLFVFLDPDITEADASNMMWAFVFEDVPREKFKKEYPKFADLADRTTIGNGDGWIAKDHVRRAEYFRRVPKLDRLIKMTDPVTQEETVLPASKIPKTIRDQILADKTTKTRPIKGYAVEWFLIVGDEIVDRRDWPGKYIPICRVVGEETVIDGIMDRKGHTRALIDPQRIYNYWTSSGVEFVALQSKSPYVAPARAIEGLETYWENANNTNSSVLPYNDMDDKGQPIQAPVRQQPPTFAPAYIQGMEVSAREMEMVSGQHEANMGEQGNERSGVAIEARQRMGDVSTYHFIDNLATAIRFAGKILIDLIPQIYDTQRIMKILAEDEAESEITVDPTATQAYLEKQKMEGEKVKGIFNPNVGQYEVEADVGPNYATRRQEAFNAFKEIVTASPDLVSIIGDLLFKNADFPGADKIAERLERLVPAQAKGEGPSPNEQKMAEQIQLMQQTIQELTVDLTEKQLKLTGKDQMRDIDSYKAESDRVSKLSNAIPEMGTNPILEAAIIKVLTDMFGADADLNDIFKANQQHAKNKQAEDEANKDNDATREVSNAKALAEAQGTEPRANA